MQNYDLARYNPFEDAKGYNGAVLIIRGIDDPLVDTTTCESYLELYQGKKELVEIKGGNHNFASIQAREGCERAILQFVKDIIK